MESWYKVKVLGRGSFGCVYLAHSTSGLPLAVKTSTLKESWSLEKENRILQQFSGCSQVIQHYGGSFEHLDNDNAFYNLVLEYANGGTLLDLIAKYGGKIPECHVRKYTKVLLKGLSCIHRKGLVHCDLKPENILVFHDDTSNDQDGLSKLKIADFGLAKERGEKQLDWRMKFRGTPCYMSPESVELGLISTSLDIWSLGCIVLEMITGEFAWETSDDATTTLFKLLENESPRIRGRLSEEGRDFLSKCFNRNAWKRWTADMLLNHPFIVNDFLGDDNQLFTTNDEQLSILDDDFIENFVRVAISSSDDNHHHYVAYLRKGCFAANGAIEIQQPIQHVL